jgi:HPt (histidine-containing phosphotransfer) domain-containing protein
MSAADRTRADAGLVADRLAALAEDTGLAIADLRDQWASQTADQIAMAAAALASGELAEVVRLVHSAAGTTGLCGAASLAHALTGIERLAAAGRAEDARTALGTAQAEFDRLTTVLRVDGGPGR